MADEREREIADLRRRLAALEGTTIGAPLAAPKVKRGTLQKLSAVPWYVWGVSVLVLLYLLGSGAPGEVEKAAVSRADARATIASQIHITLGRGDRSSSFTTYPLVARNDSARTLRFVSVECSFYRGDELVGSDSTNFVHVGTGETMRGRVRDRGRGDRYECSAEPTPE